MEFQGSIGCFLVLLESQRKRVILTREITVLQKPVFMTVKCIIVTNSKVSSQKEFWSSASLSKSPWDCFSNIWQKFCSSNEVQNKQSEKCHFTKEFFVIIDISKAKVIRVHESPSFIFEYRIRFQRTLKLSAHSTPRVLQKHQIEGKSRFHIGKDTYSVYFGEV